MLIMVETDQREVLGWKKRKGFPETTRGGKQARTAGNDCTPDSPITSGIAPYTGTFGRAELIHLLKRTLFGVTKDDIDHFTGMSLSQVLQEIVVVENTIGDPAKGTTEMPLRDYNSSNGDLDYAGIAMGEPWPVEAIPSQPFEATYDNFARDLTVRKWNMGLALNQSRNVHEKVCLFWHNHFPISVSLLNRAQRSWLYVDTIRKNANTSLDEFVKIMTIDPAMLMYLNGEVNSKGSPDENFAREVQELFTIGKELPVDKRYTEEDVQEAARALTGHGIDFSNYLDAIYSFSTWSHDTGDKQFSAFYSNTVISGSNDGQDEIDQFVAMLFDDTDNALTPLVGTKWESWTRADVIADHLAKKIYRFFVYNDEL